MRLLRLVLPRLIHTSWARLRRRGGHEALRHTSTALADLCGRRRLRHRIRVRVALRNQRRGVIRWMSLRNHSRETDGMRVGKVMHTVLNMTVRVKVVHVQHARGDIAVHWSRLRHIFDEWFDLLIFWVVIDVLPGKWH